MPENQLFFEEVNVGAELPSLTKQITRKTLVQFAGATDDWAEIHYDDEAARRAGFDKGVIAPGTLIWSMMGQLMTDWIGEASFLKLLEAQYRSWVLPGDTITYKGVVNDKYVKDGQNYVECELWAENQNGERVVPGHAVAILPSRD